MALLGAGEEPLQVSRVRGGNSEVESRVMVKEKGKDESGKIGGVPRGLRSRSTSVQISYSSAFLGSLLS